MAEASTLAKRSALLFGSLFGATGVMLAAAATHTADTQLLSNASAMALAHAPVLIAISLGWEKLRTAVAASLAMTIGILLFAGDLLARHFTGSALFPMAAPIGGIAMVASWIILAASAFLRPRQDLTY